MNLGKTLLSQLMDFLPWSTLPGSWRGMVATITAATERILTTRADCALTSVCRVPAVVNRRSPHPQLIKL